MFGVASCPMAAPPDRIRARSYPSFSPHEKRLLELVPWENQSPRRVGNRKTRGLEAVSAPDPHELEGILAPEAEEFLIRTSQVIAALAWLDDAEAVATRVATGTVMSVRGLATLVFLPGLAERARATGNPLFHWAAISMARECGAKVPVETLDYLARCGNELLSKGDSLDSGNITAALGLKQPGGRSGPGNPRRQARRDDRETYLALLLALRLAEGTKPYLAREDVAKYARLRGSTTVVRAWHKAQIRADRILRSFLALSPTLMSATIRAQNTQETIAFAETLRTLEAERSEDFYVLSGAFRIKLYQFITLELLGDPKPKFAPDFGPKESQEKVDTRLTKSHP